MKQSRGVYHLAVLLMLAMSVLITACSAAVTSDDEQSSDEPDTPEPPATIVCANGAVAGSDPSTCERGSHAISGIDQIPLSLVKMTNRQMQSRYFIVDLGEWDDHPKIVGNVACASYITASECWERSSRHSKQSELGGVATVLGSGTSPFTELVFHDDPAAHDWVESELRMARARIVSYSLHPIGGRIFIDWDYTHLVVQGAGNDGSNEPWFGCASPSCELHGRDRYFTKEMQDLIEARIAQNKLLLVAGWDKADDGTYIRHTKSNSCKGVEDGCLWAPFSFHQVPGNEDIFKEGTSLSTPNVSAALASVLSVFPNTSFQNLAKLAKLCAKKAGHGVEQLLQESGGVGVADFSCMVPIIDALQNLPAGATVTDIIIDGKTVRVSEQELIVP